MGILTHFEQPLQLLRLDNILLCIAGLGALVVFRCVLTWTYNIYFHPLRDYPGPKYLATTNLIHLFICATGNEVPWVQRLHEQYGEVVRLSPDRLSYIHPQAWKDIQGHRLGGRPEHSKDPRFYPLDYWGEWNIVTQRNTDEHGQMRKTFSNAFSDKALKLQEPLIRTYVDMLIRNINRAITAKPGSAMDFVKLYNFTTFDIMGDLAFGEPLGLLETSEYTPWVKAVFGMVKYTSFLRLVMQYPLLGRIIRAIQPQSLRDMERRHYEHANTRVDRRLAKGVDLGKPDIWKLILQKEENPMSLAQMYSNSSVFMAAGTETTASALSGVTFYLLQHPTILQKLVNEVRSLPQEDLSLEVLPRLPYLNACLKEGLRLFPPAPIGFPRQVAEGGAFICGKWVPEGISVVVSGYASNRSDKNFKDPNSFVPERWLPDSGYDSDRKDAFQPFSYGPRNCLGQNLANHELRTILATVLWHFDLELCPGSESWADQKAYVLWEKKELQIKVTPRK